MNNHDIGNFIATKRREKNLTQEQLASKLGVSNKTISKWENGKCMPDYIIIESLCKELDITLTELLEGKAVACKEIINNEKYEVLAYQIKQIESKIRTMKHTAQTGVGTGISFGCALAMIISYVSWHSIGWAILHGVFGWGYVIYYLIIH